MSVDRHNPSSVQRRFSAAAHTYHEHASVQQTIGERLAEMIDHDFEPSAILEIGCGTGVLTRLLLDVFPGTRICAVDLSDRMIEQARRYCGFSRRVEWCTADAAGFSADRKFSLIISNCAMHWVVPVERAFLNLAPQIEPGGLLICSVMLNGTLQELHDTRLHVAPRKKPRGQLPSENEVIDAIAKSGLENQEAKVEPFEIAYNSAQAFLRAIHDQGLTGGIFSSAHHPLTRGELELVCRLYEKNYSTLGGVRATYRAGFFIARQPSSSSASHSL